MMYRFLLIVLFLAAGLSTGCLRNKDITGDEFISREVLVDVLVDIHLMDGVTNDRKFYRRYEGVDSIDVLSPILEKYEVTMEMFDTTMVEYSRNPELLDKVYNDVLTKLNVMLDENEDAE
jgi:hypothetical protein